MEKLRWKIEENKKRVLDYDNEIAKNKKMAKVSNLVDGGCAAVFIVSGLSIFLINPVAIIPCAISLYGTHLVHKKQKQLEININNLTVTRGILLTENDKIEWEMKNEKRKIEKQVFNDEMTVGISKKPLVKSKNL